MSEIIYAGDNLCWRLLLIISVRNDSNCFQKPYLVSNNHVALGYHSLQ